MKAQDGIGMGLEADDAYSKMQKGFKGEGVAPMKQKEGEPEPEQTSDRWRSKAAVAHDAKVAKKRKEVRMARTAAVMMRAGTCWRA